MAGEQWLFSYATTYLTKAATSRSWVGQPLYSAESKTMLNDSNLAHHKATSKITMS
jgi:hypothetical protein